MNRRHFYHCTTDWHGPVLVVGRRTPRQPAQREPPTPRLCVSPTVACCFAARLFTLGRPVHVYRTERPCRGVTPVGVWDVCITRERWLIPPMRLVFDHTIAADVAERCQAGVRLYHATTKKHSDLRLRVAQYRTAALVLGTAQDLRRSARMLAALALPEPDDYVLARLTA